MKEYLPAIASFIAGLFAILSPFITWKLKNSSDERTRQTAIEKEKRDQIKQLYTDIFVLFDRAIKQVLQKEEFSLAREFSEATAKIRLLAPEKIASQYSDVSFLLEEWAQLYYRATPQQTKIEELTFTTLQSPDPTAQFKEPANLAFNKLQEELHKLIELMRAAF